MGYNLIFKIFNFSDVFGGQEKYIEYLLDDFKSRGVVAYFFGGPSGLGSLGLCNSGVLTNSMEVELFNGNRALYKRFWRSGALGIKVYVQHSHVQDGQGHWVKKLIRKVLLRLLLMRMDIVIRVCKDALPDHYSPGKIYTIYNGVPVPVLLGVSNVVRPLTLLMVGAVNENKNQRLALRLLKKDPGLHLIIVGDGPDKLALEQWTKTHNINERVRWIGFVDDPSPFYLQADALLLLSAYEAFPYAMLEAMAYALPVVATRVGGVPEAITHEQDGLLLPSRDLESLSAAVSRLKDNPEWRVQLGQRARQTVIERFTVEKMADNLLNVIDVVARKKGLVV